MISGGPGAGKTTLRAALRGAGFATAGEVSRQLTQEQAALGGGLAPWQDLAGFAKLALARRVAQHQHATRRGDPTVFDWGLPDSIACLKVAGLFVPPAYYAAGAAHPY